VNNLLPPIDYLVMTNYE